MPDYYYQDSTLSGVLFVIFMIVKQSKSVIKTIKKAEINKSYSVKLIRTSEYTSSFSFFSYVFVNPSITDVETEGDCESRTGTYQAEALV